MNKKLLIIGLLAATVLQSCVSYIKTVGEEPIKKSFESGEAARVFYEAIFVRDQTVNSDKNQSLRVEVGVGPPISWQKRITDHKRVNDAFRSADQDQNGTLSLKEAQRFAKLKP